MKNLYVIALFALSIVSCQESLEDRCERETKTYTAKNCPVKLHENIRIDSLTFERSTHTIHYHYTLLGNADNQQIIDQMDVVGLLKRELKNTTDMKVYKDNGYNFKYTYYSEKDAGRIMKEVALSKKDY